MEIFRSPHRQNRMVDQSAKVAKCILCIELDTDIMKIESGEIVVLILQNPREKVFGVLHEISNAGVYLRCIDLNYFDDWVNAIRNNEPYLSMQDGFYPMWRVERLSRDEKSLGIHSMSLQFEEKTGSKISEF